MHHFIPLKPALKPFYSPAIVLLYRIILLLYLHALRVCIYVQATVLNTTISYIHMYYKKHTGHTRITKCWHSIKRHSKNTPTMSSRSAEKRVSHLCRLMSHITIIDLYFHLNYTCNVHLVGKIMCLPGGIVPPCECVFGGAVLTAKSIIQNTYHIDRRALIAGCLLCTTHRVCYTDFICDVWFKEDV